MAFLNCRTVTPLVFYHYADLWILRWNSWRILARFFHVNAAERNHRIIVGLCRIRQSLYKFLVLELNDDWSRCLRLFFCLLSALFMSVFKCGTVMRRSLRSLAFAVIRLLLGCLILPNAALVAVCFGLVWPNNRRRELWITIVCISRPSSLNLSESFRFDITFISWISVVQHVSGDFVVCKL